MPSLSQLIIFCVSLLSAAAATDADSSDVTLLTSETFPQIVGQGSSVFVKFYAPWCGHCKHLAPIWDQLAGTFKEERKVVIAKVDATVDADLARKYNVRGYPTLLFFPAGQKEPALYQGARTLEAFTDFVNEKAGTSRNPDGTPNVEFGLLTDIGAALDGITCDSEDVKACLHKISGVISKATEEITSTASSVTEIAKKFYVSALEKATADWGYMTKELSRLTRLLQNQSHVNPSKLSSIVARKNILTDLYARLCAKVPQLCHEQVKEEL